MVLIKCYLDYLINVMNYYMIKKIIYYIMQEINWDIITLIIKKIF